MTTNIPTSDAVPLVDAVLSHSAQFTDIAAVLVLGIAVAFLAYLFQPLLKGMLRAAWMFVKARLQAAGQPDDAATLNRLARSADGLEPNLAAELRAMAARG
jgi:hypothetical protein